MSVHNLQMLSKENSLIFIHAFILIVFLVCVLLPLSSLSDRLLPTLCPRRPPTHHRPQFPDGRPHPRRLLRRRSLRHERPQPELPHWSHVKMKRKQTKLCFALKMIRLPPHASHLHFSSPPLRSITKTVVNPEIRKEISENQKVPL